MILRRDNMDIETEGEEMAKRFLGQYESDEIVCGSHIHSLGRGSTMKTMKGYINWYRKHKAQFNPRNFCVYDTYADGDPNEHVPCVYQED